MKFFMKILIISPIPRFALQPDIITLRNLSPITSEELVPSMTTKLILILQPPTQVAANPDGDSCQGWVTRVYHPQWSTESNIKPRIIVAANLPLPPNPPASPIPGEGPVDFPETLQLKTDHVCLCVCAQSAHSFRV